MPSERTVQKQGQQKENGGFTLIEVLIAMAIFSIGFLAVWQMQIRAVNSNALGRDVTEAATLAASNTEDLFGANYLDTALDEGSHAGTGQPPYTVGWNVNEDDDIAGLKQVGVTVNWGSRNVPIITYIVDHP